MPPCLLAIRSLLRSRSRSPQAQFCHILPAQHPWRTAHHLRYGTAAGGGSQQDDASSTTSSTSYARTEASLPVEPSPPIERSLGSYTSAKEPYWSESRTREVFITKDGLPTGRYISAWDALFARLNRMNYRFRQDEDERASERRMLVFDRVTVDFATELQAKLVSKSFGELNKIRESRELVLVSDPVETRPETDSEAEAELDGSAASASTSRPPAPATPTPTIWDSLNADKHRLWLDVALWFLAYDPDNAVSFLLVTHCEPYPPITAIQDSLLHLAEIFSSREHDQEKLPRLRALGGTLRLLARRSTGETLSLLHGTVAKILPACGPAQQLQIWDNVKTFGIDIGWNAYLHFATRLARNDHLEQALEAIHSAHKKGADLTSKQFLSTSSTLLRSAMRQPSGLRVCLRIVDTLVEMGVKLNLILCNIIMLNAVEAQDFNTAWSIYHSLGNYGLEANDYTFAVLLKACKINLDDADMLNETIRNAIAHVDVKGHPILAADMLHTLSLHHTKHHPEKAFETLSDAYSQLFDTTPLSDLGILPPRETAGNEERKLPPYNPAIGVMLSTYLHQLFLQTQSPTQPLALWRRFRELVEAGQEPWVTMMEKDYIPNAFLMTLTKTKAGIMGAAEVVKYMQKRSKSTPPSSVSSSVEDEGASKKDKGANGGPTVKTWTIFMHGFQRHGQMRMAEQVLEHMKREGMEPDRVMLNVLVHGWAYTQDVEGVERALQEFKKSDLGWDGFTRSAVGKLRNGRVGKERREPDEGSGTDFTKDLQADLEKRIQGEVQQGEEGKYVPIV